MDNEKNNQINNEKNNQVNTQIKISGSIGMEKLTNGDKNVFIFHDDHSNLKYCAGSKSVFLYDIIDNLLDSNMDYIVLLEEPFVSDYSNIKFLWNDTPHVIKFRNFYKKIISKCSSEKICLTFPIDIRLILTDVSLDEIVSNINSTEYFRNYNPGVEEYFRYIGYLFGFVEFDEKKFKKSDKNLLFIKKIFDIFKEDEYYLKLKNKFEYIYCKYLSPKINTYMYDFIYDFIDDQSNKTNSNQNPYVFIPGFPFENTNSSEEETFLSEYDKLINGIMEFYTFILITGLGRKNIILYSGHYHSKNLSYLLEKYYNYKKIYLVGNTENLELITASGISIGNCLLIDKNIFFTP